MTVKSSNIENQLLTGILNILLHVVSSATSTTYMWIVLLIKRKHFQANQKQDTMKLYANSKSSISDSEGTKTTVLEALRKHEKFFVSFQRYAAPGNNRDTLLHLSFTLKISTFLVAYLVGLWWRFYCKNSEPLSIFTKKFYRRFLFGF